MHHTHRANPDLTGIASEISVFTLEECEQIISLALQTQEARDTELVLHASGVDSSICSATQISMDEQNFPGLYEHIKKVFIVGNFLKFHYTSMKIQVMRYRKGDFYMAHTDWSVNNNKRKLSMSIQLSPPDDYKGGEVLIHAGPESLSISKEQGVGVVWPSWLLHESTPLMSGERWVLVAWAEGQPFV
jgi:PKHD-type hydroxylase